MKGKIYILATKPKKNNYRMRPKNYKDLQIDKVNKTNYSTVASEGARRPKMISEGARRPKMI